ncbi:MAG: hypothetical protein F4188_05475 [Chloroflexi bacterium]|nr:hypothetical protein [Chloroflexota bacterium]
MLRSAWVVVLFPLVAGLVLLAAQVSAQSSQEWVVTSSADSGQGTLRWAIDGANEIVAAGSMVRGIGVFGFEPYGIGVEGVDASQVTIDANWIGLRPDGTASANRLSGVAVIGGASGARVSNNRIAGNSVQERTGHGIVIGGGGSVDAVVSGNVIGISGDGSPLPNDDGILVVDSAQATIRDNTI